MKVYFDNAATTQIHPKVLEKMLHIMNDDFGNPSSFHSIGRKAKVAIEEAREIAAEFIGANPSEIYFTSGGTESINFALNGIAKTNLDDTGRKHLVTNQIEHKAVLEKFNNLSHEGFKTTFIPSEKSGFIDPHSIANAVTPRTSLVSTMLINNEIGTINDIPIISQMISQDDLYLFTDSVQAFGKIRINVNELNVDSLCASAHKLYGPKGIGLLYVKSGTPLSPLLYGGSQERNRRAGTENVAGIVGFAEAIRIADDEMEENYSAVKNLNKYFIQNLLDQFGDTIEINGGDNTSPYIFSVTFKSDFYNNDSEGMLMFLDINGISASQGSACTSGTLKASHVILGISKSTKDANGTMRFSFSPQNTFEEVEYVIDILVKLSKNFRK
ncbi:MAG: cysteine desulfurase family protein [Bacteroidota bacterium]